MDRYREQEVGHAKENVVRPDQLAALFLKLASTSALDHGDTQPTPSAFCDDLRFVRRYCGRWLALRQLNLGLSNEMIVERTGVDAQTLLALELGLIDTRQLADADAARLCQAFLTTPSDANFVAAVIDIARGRADDHDGSVMERVMADLQPPVDDTPAL